MRLTAPQTGLRAFAAAMPADVDPGFADPFSVAVAEAERDTLSMVRAALAERRMRLAFQPAVYAADPKIIGFYEGYLRLQDPAGRIIPASAFMAEAEGHELGRQLDCAALELALQALGRHPGIRVAVNMSARSIGYGPWRACLHEALRSRPTLGAGLILEISEASAIQMPDVLMPFLQEWRPYGVTFTLDDFADGMTSLPLLQEYRFEIAKLDGRHVRDVDHDPARQCLLRAAIALAREFNMFAVAEAVETNAEANWLSAHGVGCLQGYLFGRPEVAPDFTLFRHGRS